MQGLTALRQLMIRDCPNLSRKCRQEDGHKIAHVPDVDLDEDSGCSSEIDDDMSSYLPKEDDEGCTSEEHDEVSPNLSSCTILVLTMLLI